jgi:5-methylcytosine-specific restriction endonuclease McrBC regulatory subunit McrC
LLGKARRPETVRVLEYGRIHLPPSLDTARTRERLIRAGAGRPFDVFTINSRGIWAAGAVGMVDIGNLQVEILPKASGTVTVAADPAASGQTLLRDLLCFSGLAPRAFSRGGRTATGDLGLVDALLRAFALDLLDALQDGSPRRYAVLEEVSTVIRGRPDLQKLARRTPGADHMVPVRYAPLQPDNNLGRLLLAATEAAARASRSAGTRSLLLHCVELMDAVTRVPLTRELASSVELNQFEGQWRRAAAFAGVLAEGRRPDPVSAGGTTLFGILFSLNDLFESLLRRSFAEALRESELKLEPPSRNRFLLESMTSGVQSIALKPDFLFVDRDGTRKVVGDAKWKRLRPDRPAFGLKASDTYQIGTYLARDGLERALFFFPSDDWMSDHVDFDATAGWWRHRFKMIGPAAPTISIVGVPVRALVSSEVAVRTTALRTLRAMVEWAMT